MISIETKNWEIKNIDTVFFDKDGTFVDLHFFWGKMTELRAKEVIKVFDLDENLFEKLCNMLGYCPVKQKMFPDGITALYSRSKIIEIFKGNLLEFNVKTTDIELEEIFDRVSELFYQNMYAYIKPIDEAIDLIKKLKNKNIKTAIITADSKVSCEKTLNHFNWNSLFDFVIARESTKETKESGCGAKLALKELGADPSKTIMIGDSPTDFECAKNAGIEKTILVSTGQVEKNVLLETSQYVVESLAEIKINEM